MSAIRPLPDLGATAPRIPVMLISVLPDLESACIGIHPWVEVSFASMRTHPGATEYDLLATIVRACAGSLMIITLEGSPGVGKSTLATASGALVVPEVNLLYGKRPLSAQHHWYLERQLDRWALAEEGRAIHDRVLLDGDVFQPIWFATLFHGENWGDPDAIQSFFERAAADKRVRIPDLYVVLLTTESLRARREHQRSAARGRTAEQIDEKIKRYQPFQAFQLQLFSAMNEAFPGLIRFIDAAKPVSENVEQLNRLTPAHRYQPDAVLGLLCRWCQSYRARAGAAR